VLSVGVLAGVVIGIALSLAWLVHVTTSPAMPLLARDDGVAVLRLDGGLFFATADPLHDRLREVAEAGCPPLRVVVLDLVSVDFIDAQGAAKLTELQRLAAAHGIELRLTGVQGRVRAVLDADGQAAPAG
jgi:sulfate permease, SulP family